MALFKLRRKRRVKASRRRGVAPLLPEPIGLSGTARRVNRLVAAVALFGAFGTVALAVALTPGAQPSASTETATKAPLALSEITAQAAPVAEPRPPTPVLAALPQPAPKADRLSFTPWALRASQPVAVDRSPDAQPLRPSVPDEAINIVMAPERPDFAIEAAASSGPDIEPEASDLPELGDTTTAETSTETGDGASAEASEEASEEASPEAIDAATTEATTLAIAVASAEADQADDEAITEASEEAKPEPVKAIRTAAVKTDVNMRAGPDNGAAVIRVVPARSDVEVIGCDYWCEVIFAGKRGWIYKSFLRHAKS